MSEHSKTSPDFPEFESALYNLENSFSGTLDHIQNQIAYTINEPDNIGELNATIEQHIKVAGQFADALLDEGEEITALNVWDTIVDICDLSRSSLANFAPSVGVRRVTLNSVAPSSDLERKNTEHLAPTYTRESAVALICEQYSEITHENVTNILDSVHEAKNARIAKVSAATLAGVLVCVALLQRGKK